MTRADELEGLSRRLLALAEHLEHQPLTHADSMDRATIREAAAKFASLQAEVERLKHDAGELVVVQYELSAVKADRENLAECNALIGQDLREAIDRAEKAARERDTLAALLKEAREVVKRALSGLDAGCTQYAARTVFGSEVAGDEQLPWVRLMQIGRDAARAFLDKTGDCHE